MLRTIGRILIILLVIGLVAGGFYWIGQSHPSILGLNESHLGFMEEGTLTERGVRETFDRDDESENGLPLDFQQAGMRQHDGEGRLDSDRAFSGTVRNILIIAVITLLVVGIQRFYTWLLRRRSVRAV